MKRSKFISGAAALALVVAVMHSHGGEEKPAVPNKAVLDANAVALLRSTLDFLNSTKSYSTVLTHKTSLDGGAGKKQDRTSKYELSVERPNKLALVIKDGMLRCAVLSDGQTLCTYAPPKKQYTQKEAPKSLNDLFDIDEMQLVRDDLGGLLFLDQFSLKDGFDMIMKDVMSVKLEGEEDVDGVKMNKLHFTEAEDQFTIWIQSGKEPLVRKVEVEFEKDLPSPDGMIKTKVHIVTQFDDWKINQEIPKDRFVFTPPSDAKKVDTFLEMPEAYDPKLLGETAPALNLKLLDGGNFDLASQKGKNIVVLDFWATWCAPCRMAMPIISGVVDSYKDKGVVGYAINLGESGEKVKEFMKESKDLKLPILLDEDNKAAEAYRVQPIPMAVIIDKNGVVQALHLSLPVKPGEYKAQLTAEIDALLAGKSLLKEGGKKEADKNKEEPEAK